MKDLTNLDGGYQMPFEGGPHSHTLMGYPSIASAENEIDLERLQKEVISIANTIARYEPVQLCARPELVDGARASAGPNVIVIPATIDQLWVRDSGPTYAYDKDGKRTAIDFNFNYWGSKLPPTGDENLAAQMAQQDHDGHVRSRITTEGGAIEHDGESTFLATESSLINNNRNPGLTKADIEGEIRSKLGVTSFIWVPGVKGYDITDYHIDILARFVEPGVVVVSEPASNGPEFAFKAFREAREIISNSTDAQGRRLVVHTCTEPDVTLLGPPDKDNEVVASYVNYHLVNGAVILPKYGQKQADHEALKLFQKLFPEREVVQVYINMLARTGGGIHCATQQVILKTRTK